MSNIKLRSGDGILVEVGVDVIKSFGIFKTMLGDLGMDLDGEQVIPILKVNGHILKLLLKWVNYHKDDPPPPEDYMDNRRTDDICSWDADFLNVDLSTLYGLLEAANYLGIEGLLNLTCKTVANMMKGRNPEEIREIFGIKNDFTESEEEQLHLENAWCEEKSVEVIDLCDED